VIATGRDLNPVTSDSNLGEHRRVPDVAESELAVVVAANGPQCAVAPEANDMGKTRS
jgi:hypothetical protein